MVQAQAAEFDGLELSGFATVGAVVTDRNDMGFTRVGFDHRSYQSPDFGPDTVLGVQANLRLGERTSAVLQVRSRENPTGSYEPEPTLAFLSQQLNPALTLRLGRVRGPFFMLSDSIDVNYSHPWVRPPVEVYGLNPFVDVDGLDLLYRTRIGNTDLEIHPYFGRSRIDLHESGWGKLRNLRGLNIGVTRNQLSLHAGYSEAKLDLHWRDPFHDALAAVLAHPALGGFEESREEMSGDSGRTDFGSFGFQWEDSAWLVIGEYARRRANHFVNSAYGWHFTVGRNLGSFTPYLTFARQRQTEAVISQIPTAASQVPLPGIDMTLADAMGLFNASRNPGQRSVTAGVRWDFADQAAFKAELSRMHTEPDAGGSFYPRSNPTAAFDGDRVVNVLSLSIDVIF
jgi:hypothetical protein